MSKEEALELLTNCTINSCDYQNLKDCVEKIYHDEENKNCLNCKYDLLEDKTLNFLCELNVCNDTNGDFIDNPADFSCNQHKYKKRTEDTVVEKGQEDG